MIPITISLLTCKNQISHEIRFWHGVSLPIRIPIVHVQRGSIERERYFDSDLINTVL